MARRRQKIDIDEIVYPAHEAVRLTSNYIKYQQRGDLRRLRFGTEDVEKYLNPLMPGDLVIVCGRPQNGKTLLQQFMIHNTIQDIVKDGHEDEAAVFVTWEVPVEKATMYWLAIASGINVTQMIREEIEPEVIDDYNTAIVQVGKWPFYIIGHSIQRSKDGQRKRPMLTTEAVGQALDHLMNERQLEPRLIALDYLQRIHKLYPSMDRNEHILQAVDWAKDTAYQAGCPVVLATQAGRIVDTYSGDIQMPSLADSQWSSNAEQTADYFLSVTMPKTYHADGDEITVNGKPLVVNDRILLMAITKQKDGPAGKIFPLYVEPEYLKVEDMVLDGMVRGIRWD